MLIDGKEAGDFPPSHISEALPLVCNTDEALLYRNMQAAVDAQWPILNAAEPHDGVAILVGGGPSLADDVDQIRAMQNAGAHVFALNNAGRWLHDRGIVPYALVVLDARSHNVRFIRGLPCSVKLYLATQCDPALFAEGQDHDITAWHAPMGGKSGVVEHRNTVLIGGSTTVGMRALRLVHVLGYRTAHLFGYDSSFAGSQGHAYPQPENENDGLRECEVGDRKFLSTAWMIRQADDFRHIAFGLMHEGLTIHVHGDGLLPEVARQMNAEPPDVAVYDFAVAPASWDFVNWLMAAEMERRRRGASAPLQVAFRAGPKDGFRDDNLPVDGAGRKQIFDNVIRPLVTMIGAVEVTDPGSGHWFPYTFRQLVDAARCGETLPEFTIHAGARKSVAKILSSHGISDPIVITLREASYWPARNSNLQAWLKFAQLLESEGERVVFVRDTAKADEPLSDFITMPEAAIDLNARAALYEVAKCNMFTNGGPMALAWFGRKPYLIFKTLVENYAPNTPEWWRDRMGVPVGTQLPWATPHQRIIWGDDDYDSLCAAWRHHSRFIRALAA